MFRPVTQDSIPIKPRNLIKLQTGERNRASSPSAARRADRIPRGIRTRLRAWPVTVLGAVIGSFAHGVMLAFFAHYGLTVMVWVNMLSMTLWLAGAYLAWRGWHGVGIAVASAEMVMHAVFAAWQVGLGAGFQLYLWSAACLLVLNPYMRSDRALVAGVFVSVVFAVLHLILPPGAIVAPLRDVQSALYFVNALCAPLPIVFVVIMVRQTYARQQKALRAIAEHDEVTGLFNRRHGMTVLQASLDAAAQSNDALFVVLCDIDRFKSINDAHGHQVGDSVLAHVGHVMAAGLRSDDMLCRWGGEEFLMVLPGFPEDAIRDRLDALRGALATTLAGGDIPRVTMSFGLTKARPGDSADELVRRADALMYEAKRAGRNKVVDDLQPRVVAMPTIMAGAPASGDPL